MEILEALFMLLDLILSGDSSTKATATTPSSSVVAVLLLILVCPFALWGLTQITPQPNQLLFCFLAALPLGGLSAYLFFRVNIVASYTVTGFILTILWVSILLTVLGAHLVTQH